MGKGGGFGEKRREEWLIPRFERSIRMSSLIAIVSSAVLLEFECIVIS